MMASYKNPPKLTDTLQYENWIKQLKLWAICSKVDKKEQAPAVALSLEGRAREAALELTIEELNVEEGLNNLITKLDGLFLKDEHQRTYVSYAEFEEFKRPEDMTIDNYINDFERLYNKVKSFKIELPDQVLAYRLLKSANLHQNKMELVRATISELGYSEMKKQLRKLEDIAVSKRDTKTESDIKDEPAETLYTRGGRFRGRGRSNGSSRGTRGSCYNGRGNNQATYHNSNNGRGNNQAGYSNSNKNRYDDSGNITKCFNCKSVYHWAKDCPRQSEFQSENWSCNVEEINITLFTKGIESTYQGKLLGETIGCAVLDSGCTRNVCSDYWLYSYIESLDEKKREKVCYQDSRRKFRFGDNKTFTSMTCAMIPANICGKDITIETDVIGNDIPLLLSKEAMKKANTVIDFQNDKISMFGKEINLKFTSSGHYAIPINSNSRVAYHDSREKSIPVYFSNLDKIEHANYSEKNKMCIKIHRQFSHASGKRLKKLLVDGGITDKEMLKIIETIHDNCEICVKYKKPPPKPIVCTPLAKEFNESIAMDLKDIEGESGHVLHLIDHATRYSAAIHIPSKKKEVIISAVLKVWISLFGPPKKILTDNGKEFSNDDYREMGEKLNTRIVNTAAESPWSNGINERHNAVLADMITKIMQDVKCSLKDAIVWAVSAKNALANVYGYSPNQLVFGKNPNFPSVLYDKLPALNNESKSKVLLDNLNALHSARQAFISAESNERIRRALRAKTRSYTSDIFQNGDSVYYKREGVPAWKGPGCVIGFEGKTVLVKHGSVYVRVHPSRLIHENSEFRSSDRNDTMTKEDKHIDIQEDGNNEIDESIEAEEKENLNESIEYEDLNSYEPVEEDEVARQVQNNEDDTVDHDNIAQGNTESDQNYDVLYPGSVIPKRQQHVLAKTFDNEWNEYTIMSRAGKATGQYADWVNVHNKNTNKGYSVNWREEIEEWKEVEPEEVLISYAPSHDVMDAMFKELEKWRDYDVYDEVEDIGQKLISVRWVYTEKDGKSKARLVARGFEDNEVNARKDSPTCSKMNLRLIIAIAASKGWKINSVDIQSAYLQGQNVERNIFLKPPAEANTPKIWKLKKYVYGLHESGRMWYLKVCKELISLGMERSKFDEAIFFWHRNGHLEGIMSAHVDDFFGAGTDLFKASVIKKMIETFNISRENQINFKYLGLQVNQLNEKICLNQSVYEEGIETIQLEGTNDSIRKLTKNEQDNLRSVVGQILWLANQTRPDIAFDACFLSNSLSNAKVADIIKANKIIRKIKQNKTFLTFSKINDIEKSKLLIWPDASFQNLPGGASQGGYVILLSDKEGNTCPIHWQSRKIKRIVKSTLAAECLALQEACETAFYLKTVLTEILNRSKKDIHIDCFTDNKSLVDSLHSSKTLEEKRLILDEAVIKDMMQKEEINKIQWVDNEKQIADSLTKATASSEKLRDVLQRGNVSDLLN